jgi:hypothetical protein
MNLPAHSVTQLPLFLSHTLSSTGEAQGERESERKCQPAESQFGSWGFSFQTAARRRNTLSQLKPVFLSISTFKNIFEGQKIPQGKFMVY